MKLFRQAGWMAAAGCAAGLASGAILATGGEPLVQWDEHEAESLAHALHRMHEMVNEGDAEGVRALIATDDVLATFDLGMDSEPVVLRSRDEVINFLDDLTAAASEAGSEIYLDRPVHSARATKEFGVVTEECTVRFKGPDGTERVDKLFGTNVGVKYPDGWKFIQWHMSVAAPPTYYKNGELVGARDSSATR